MSHPSRYYADDKDVFDLVMSQRKLLSDEVLRGFLRERGVVVSPELDREELALYLSRLPFGWHDIDALTSRLSSARTQRAQRNVSDAVAVSLDAIEAAAAQVRLERGDRRREEYRISRTRDGAMEIQVNYTVLDTGRNRMRQRSEQRFDISVESYEGGVRVRFPEDERAREIAEAIIFAAMGDQDLRQPISLGNSSAANRTLFFEKLTNGIDGYSTETVSRVAFRQQDDSTDDSEFDGDSDIAKLLGPENAETGGRILRVQLDGENVFTSGQFIELKKSGFYVSGVVWRSRQAAGDGITAEFDAHFSFSNSVPVFTYRLRGVFRRNEHGEVMATRESPSEGERRQLLRALETAAITAEREVKALGDSGLNALSDADLDAARGNDVEDEFGADEDEFGADEDEFEAAEEEEEESSAEEDVRGSA